MNRVIPCLSACLAISAALLPGVRAATRQPQDAATDFAAHGGLDEVHANDNRASAGRLVSGVLTIRLEAREGIWYPETRDGVGIAVYAFAEQGRLLQVPGPMIRVRAGTQIRMIVSNTLPKQMRLRGLQDHQTTALDTFDIVPGATREIRFRPDAPGTYFYWGRTDENQEGLSDKMDSQLLGAFIVDPAGTAPPRGERVMVVTHWADTLRVPGAVPEPKDAFGINGLSWPHTERLHHAVGDTVRWRVINATTRRHPMHLHGFYFQVDGRGDAVRDTFYTPRQRRLAVTEFMVPGSTLAMEWVPARPGNWVFHCHLIAHIDARLRLGSSPRHAGHAINHATEGMAGLVMGIHVGPARGVGFAPDPVARRKLRLFINTRPRVFDTLPGYSFVLQVGTASPAPDSVHLPSSTIALHRGEPTEITVINRTRTHVSIHWHGIELGSYYDGVADWSGWKSRTAPAIAPGDSFVVRMTPDRAGTFIYHTHTDETVQLTSGLYGALLVLEPGAEPDTTERLFLMGAGGPSRDALPFLNGSATPGPVELTAGTTHRFRFINISGFELKRVRLLADTTLQTWRAFAKDGADLPARQASMRPALVLLGPGETYDFEVRRDSAGTIAMEIATLRRPGLEPMVIRIPVRIRSR